MGDAGGSVTSSAGSIGSERIRFLWQDSVNTKVAFDFSLSYFVFRF